MSWLLTILSPPVMLVAGVLLWIRSNPSRDPSIPVLVGIAIGLMYLGFLIGLGVGSHL